MKYETHKVGPVTVSLIPSADNYIYLIEWTEGLAIVDPGTAREVIEEVRRRRRPVTHILATHHHGDHIAGIPAIKEATGATVVGPAGGGIPDLDQAVGEGDEVKVGPLVLEVLETPGHTLDHISFYAADPGLLWCGDTVFTGGCGRLFEGTPAQLWESIHRLAELPEETRLYCGHEYTEKNLRFALSIEPDNQAVKERLEAVRELRLTGRATIPSRIAEEKETNPFVRSSEPGVANALGMPDASAVEVFAELRRRRDRF